MIHSHRFTPFRGVLMAILALVVWGLMPSSADAGLTQWLAAVNTGTLPTSVATTVFTPSIVDIGTLSGDITYEFIVNGSDRATAGSLIGALTGGQSEAIRFEQFPNTDHYGVTQYGVADHDFGVPTHFDTDVHLAFVVDSGAGTTTLFVNGVNTGATVPYALTLQGPVAFGGTDLGGGNFLGDDAFAGTILGFAAYNSTLSSDELQAHADAFFASAFATIVVKQEVANLPPGQVAQVSFGYTGSLGSFSLNDGDMQTFENVPPGTVTVTESATTGYTLDVIICDDSNSTDAGGGSADITVEPGETVTCTFITLTNDCNTDGDANVDRGDLSVILAARNTPAVGPDDPRDPNGDGIINVLDTRVCALQCTNTRCAP